MLRFIDCLGFSHWLLGHCLGCCIMISWGIIGCCFVCFVVVVWCLMGLVVFCVFVCGLRFVLFVGASMGPLGLVGVKVLLLLVCGV